MDPRFQVELERARREAREARERKMRLIQIALGSASRHGPVGWARRFEWHSGAREADRTDRRKP